MRTEELQYIIEVYKTGSISKAAERLNISAQGLGKSLKNIEDAWNCTLFERSFQGAVPTALCETIISDLCDIVEKENAVNDVIRNFESTDNNTKYIIGMESVLGGMVEDAVSQYNTNYGGHIKVILGEFGNEDVIEEAFEENKYDFRFCTKELIRNDVYKTFPIARLNYHPVVSEQSELCKKINLSFEDFEGKTLLVGNRRPYSTVFEECCKKRGVNLKVKQTFDKFYLSKLLSENTNYVYLGQRADVNKMLAAQNRKLMVLRMEPTFETNIVIQSRSGKIDSKLLNYIRKSLVSFSDRYLD